MYAQNREAIRAIAFKRMTLKSHSTERRLVRTTSGGPLHFFFLISIRKIIADAIDNRTAVEETDRNTRCEQNDNVRCRTFSAALVIRPVLNTAHTFGLCLRVHVILGAPTVIHTRAK